MASDRDDVGALDQGATESTHQLITRARGGDLSALDRIFARHFRPLRRWASGRLPGWARDVTDTDDLVQETLVQTFRRIEKLDLERSGALQAYLRQAVLNRVRSEVRRSIRRPSKAGFDESMEAGAPSPLEYAIGREAIDRYEHGLSSLRPDERELIIGRVEMGYTYPELAEATGKPTSEAARKAAERALVRLAAAMARRRS